MQRLAPFLWCGIATAHGDFSRKLKNVVQITPVRRLADGLSGSVFLRANKGGAQTCRFPGPSGIVREFSGRYHSNKGGGANLQIFLAGFVLERSILCAPCGSQLNKGAARTCRALFCAHLAEVGQIKALCRFLSGGHRRTETKCSSATVRSDFSQKRPNIT